MGKEKRRTGLHSPCPSCPKCRSLTRTWRCYNDCDSMQVRERIADEPVKPERRRTCFFFKFSHVVQSISSDNYSRLVTFNIFFSSYRADKKDRWRTKSTVLIRHTAALVNRIALVIHSFGIERHCPLQISSSSRLSACFSSCHCTQCSWRRANRSTPEGKRRLHAPGSHRLNV